MSKKMFFAPMGVPNPYLANLSAYYPFDSSSNDFSGNVHNGTDMSISYANAGKVGNSATFNGTSSNISVPNSPDFDFSGVSSDVPFSISIWLYVTNTYLRYVIGRGSSSANLQFDCSINPNFSFWLYSGVSQNYMGKIMNEPITLNTWTNFCVTYDGSSNVSGLKLYKNGVLKTTDNYNDGYTKMNQNTDPLYIGRRSYGAVGYFSGGQDELAIWKNRVLNSTEVLDIYNKGVAGIPLI